MSHRRSIVLSIRTLAELSSIVHTSQNFILYPLGKCEKQIGISAVMQRPFI